MRFDARVLPLGIAPKWAHRCCTPDELCDSQAWEAHRRSNGPFYCTGPRGHAGDHYADTADRCVATWPRVPKPKNGISFK